MTEFTQEIKRLQKLSCISLTPEEEKKLWFQLTEIIWFLGKLPETKMNNEQWMMNNEWWKMNDDGKLWLRTIDGIKESSESKKILKNVKHPIINNSIVIKSVLN